MVIGELTRPVGDQQDEGVSLWFYRLDQAIRRRKDEEDGWEHNENFAKGKHWDGSEGNVDADTTQVNKIGAWLEMRCADLKFNNPRVIVRPQNADGWSPVTIPVIDPQTGPVYQTHKIMMPDGTEVDTGEPVTDMQGQPVPETRRVSRHVVVENTINFIIGQPDFGQNDVMDRVVTAGQLAYGAIKVGYRPYFESDLPGEKEERMIPIDPNTGEPDFSGFEVDDEGMPIEDEDEHLIPKGAGPTSEKWFMRWANYRNILIDPDGENDFRDHRFVAYEFLMRLKDVKRDPLYKNTSDLEATGNLTADTDEPPTDNPFANRQYVKKHEEMVRLFEVCDFENNRIVVLADGHGKYLRNVPMPVGVSHSPYVFYRPKEILGEFYPRPPASDGAVINDEYNVYRQQQLLQMRRSTRKIMYKKGALDTNAKVKLTNNEDMALVEVDTQGPLSDVVMPVPVPNVSSDVFAYGQGIALDFDETMGQPSEMRGVARADTATQAQIMQGGNTSRIDAQRKKLASVYREAYKKLLDSVQANMDTKMAVTINGSDGQIFQTIVSRDMLVGDFDVDVDVVEMEPRNTQAEAANKLQLAQIAGQSPWLMVEEDSCRGWCHAFNIRDEVFIKAMWRGAQHQMALLMAPKQPQAPTSGAPQNEADAISQAAGRSA